MGLLVYIVLMRRWVAARLEHFDDTFLSKSLEKPLTPVQSPSQGWVIALESASRGWEHWQ